jgi:hypothetical protein
MSAVALVLGLVGRPRFIVTIVVAEYQSVSSSPIAPFRDPFRVAAKGRALVA